VVDYTKYLDKLPKLSVPGIHNRMDAAAALAVADMLGVKEEVAQKALAEFSGTWRRLEKKGETAEGAIIYDDYAHHPTEIQASLQALRELYPKGNKKITVLFQPHLYSRTKALFDDFAKSFKLADQVLLLPIYFAREDKDESVSSEKLAEAIALVVGNPQVQAFSSFEQAENFIKTLNLGEKDIFVTMGAGEAYKVADKVLKTV
jgi:UDP-N-acetylmuramate--alanine ligase